MNEIIAVVEGQTEQTFVQEVLAPWLASRGVFLSAARVGKPGHKGGNPYLAAKRDIIRFLKQRQDTFVTCLFDFYGMKSDWPGREDASSASHDNKPLTIEKEIRLDIEAEFRGRLPPGRFIPYVQMHEFESLLFSYPAGLAHALGKRERVTAFVAIRNSFETPEHINDDPNTAPSKRISKIFKASKVSYRKPFHGSIAAKQTTIETMYAECPHFRSWIDSLVQLGQKS